MKKLLTVSLLAMMAVGTARADIASTNYADTVAKNKADAAQAAAISAAAETLSTTIADYSTTEQMKAAIKVETERATAAETALGTRIDNISAGELTIKKDAVTANEIKDGEVKTAEIADAAVTTAKIADKNVIKAKLSDDVQASLDKADAAAPQSTTYTMTQVDDAVADAKKAGTDAQSDLDAFKTTVSSTYQTLSNIHTAGELTGEDLNTKYPSVGYVDTAVAGVDADLSGLQTTVAGHTSKIDALEGTVGGYGDIVTKNIADFDASGAAAQALTDAKAYTDELATGAVKTNADDIDALEGRMTTAEGDIDKLETNKVSKTELGIDATFNIPDKCKAQDAVCSLVVRAGVADWEVVQP